MEDVSLNQILDVNETVMNMVTTVNELEHTLRDKLEFISNNLYRSEEHTSELQS